MEYSARRIAGALILGALFFACDKEPEITGEMLDGKVLFDSSLLAPENYLLSFSNPDPTPDEALTPVVIACHGYTASTFEWEEFHHWTDSQASIFVSRVLLGGHGRTYEDFRSSSWKDWQRPITLEYERLVAAGYQNISLLGSSTSCTLILELLSSGYFDDKPSPDEILMVDPIVVPSSKVLSLVGILGPVIGYVEADNTSEEDRYWYHFRPEETLRELNKIINRVRKELEQGIRLPVGSSMKVYKSVKDPTADPVSAVLIFKGVSHSDGGDIEVQMVDSDLHVFTRLLLRKNTSAKDQENQFQAFNDFTRRISD